MKAAKHHRMKLTGMINMLNSKIYNSPKLKAFDLQNVRGFTAGGLINFIEKAKYLRKLKIVDHLFLLMRN